MALTPVGIDIQFGVAVARFQRDLAKSGSLFRSFSGKFNKQIGGMNRASNSLSRSLGFLTSKAGLSGGALAGIAIGGNKAINAFAGVEKGLLEIGTLIGGLTKNEFADMKNEMQLIAVESGQAIESLVKARYDIISAGFIEAADSAEVMRASVDLADAGVADVSESADLLTTVINSFNLSAKDARKVAGQLFTIVQKGKTTVGQLATAFGRVSAIAGQAGISLVDVSAAIAALTAQGVLNNEAFTAMKATIIELLDPADELLGLIKSLGFASGQTLLAEEGLAGGLEKIFQRAKETNIPLSDLFKNSESLKAILPLAGTAAANFAKNIESIKGGADNARVAAKQLEGSIDRVNRRFKETAKAIATQTGEVLAPFRKELQLVAIEAASLFVLFDPELVAKKIETIENKIKGLTAKPLFFLNPLTLIQLKNLNNDLELWQSRQKTNIKVQAEFTGGQKDQAEAVAKTSEETKLMIKLVNETAKEFQKLQDTIEAMPDIAEEMGFTDDRIKAMLDGTTEIIGRLDSLGKDRFDLMRQQLDAEVAAFKAAQVDMSLILEFEAGRRAEIEAEERTTKLEEAQLFVDQMLSVVSGLFEAQLSALKKENRDESKENRVKDRDDRKALVEEQAAERALKVANFKRIGLDKSLADTKLEQLDIAHNQALATFDSDRETAREASNDRQEKAEIKLHNKIIDLRMLTIAVEAGFEVGKALLKGDLIGAAKATAIGVATLATLNAQKLGKGDVVGSPTLVGSAPNLAIAGERPGRSEAVLPLARMDGGDLGVKADFAGGSQPVIQVLEAHFHNAVMTEDLTRGEIAPIIRQMALDGELGLLTPEDVANIPGVGTVLSDRRSVAAGRGR